MSKLIIKWHGTKFSTHVHAEVVKRLKVVGAYMRRAVVNKLRKGNTRSMGPSKPGQPPHRDTGKLQQSIQWQVYEDKKAPSVLIGASTPAIYAGILEKGGTIFPKKAKALSVPVSKEAKRHKGSPTTFPRELTLVARFGRPPLLIEARKRVTKIHYVLVPSVRIHARPFLRPTLMEEEKALKKIMETGRP